MPWETYTFDFTGKTDIKPRDIDQNLRNGRAFFLGYEIDILDNVASLVGIVNDLSPYKHFEQSIEITWDVFPDFRLENRKILTRENLKPLCQKVLGVLENMAHARKLTLTLRDVGKKNIQYRECREKVWTVTFPEETRPRRGPDLFPQTISNY